MALTSLAGCRLSASCGCGAVRNPLAMVRAAVPERRTGGLLAGVAGAFLREGWG